MSKSNHFFCPQVLRAVSYMHLCLITGTSLCKIIPLTQFTVYSSKVHRVVLSDSVSKVVWTAFRKEDGQRPKTYNQTNPGHFKIRKIPNHWLRQISGCNQPERHLLKTKTKSTKSQEQTKAWQNIPKEPSFVSRGSTN